MPKCGPMIDSDEGKEMPVRYRGTEAPDDEAAGDLDLAPLFEEVEPEEIRPAPKEDCDTALLALGEDESFEEPVEVPKVENFLPRRINSFASS